MSVPWYKKDRIETSACDLCRLKTRPGPTSFPCLCPILASSQPHQGPSCSSFPLLLHTALDSLVYLGFRPAPQTPLPVSWMRPGYVCSCICFAGYVCGRRGMVTVTWGTFLILACWCGHGGQIPQPAFVFSSVATCKSSTDLMVLEA